MPPPLLTPALLKSLVNTPHLPPKTAHLITSVTLSTLNLGHEIPFVYRDALSRVVVVGGGDGGLSGDVSKTTMDDEEDEEKARLDVTRRIREGLIKAGPIIGLPKTINALYALKSVTPSSLLDAPLNSNSSSASSSSSPTGRAAELLLSPRGATHVLTRGQAFFDQTYGKVARQIMSQLDGCGTEDLGVLARLMYAHILSNTSILSAVETSFVLLAALIPQDVNPQLKGHLKGALNHGASVDNVRAVRSVVIRICEAAGMTSLRDDDDENGPAAAAAARRTGWGWRSDVAKL